MKRNGEHNIEYESLSGIPSLSSFHFIMSSIVYVCVAQFIFLATVQQTIPYTHCMQFQRNKINKTNFHLLHHFKGSIPLA